MSRTMQSSGVDQFIRDIEPFFYGRSLTYVDVGAFTGKVFRKMMNSQLNISEVHLFEPNPISFAKLKALASKVVGRRSISMHNLALGNERGRLSMHACKDMTRALYQLDHSIDSDRTCVNDASNFAVDCVTLDEVAETFTEARIDLLKIDVEGFEAKVLVGASALLQSQRVDVIYLEAGANPEGRQQCYYREIDDILAQAGYQLFRIYEQKNEWRTDSPKLRRMNLAYFSSRFADNNPYRLTRELFDVRDQCNRLEEEVGRLRVRVAAKSRKVELLRKKLVHAKARAKSYKSRYTRIKKSRSWRVTTPLRAIGHAIRRLRIGGNGSY